MVVGSLCACLLSGTLHPDTKLTAEPHMTGTKVHVSMLVLLPSGPKSNLGSDSTSCLLGLILLPSLLMGHTLTHRNESGVAVLSTCLYRREHMQELLTC